MFSSLSVTAKAINTIVFAVVPTLIAAWLANVAIGLVVLGIGTFAFTIVIWHQNRKGFARVEKLLLQKATEGQAVISDLENK